MMEKPLALLKSLKNSENVAIYSSYFDIGRSKFTKLIIPNVHISRSHCSLKCSKNQTWILHDTSSSGTYVNGELVGKHNNKTVKENDIIRLGPEDCNFIWKFITNIEKYQSSESSSSGFIDSQSQTIVDICNEKDTLQRQIILNRESCRRMMQEKEKLQTKYFSQFRHSQNRFLSPNEKLKKKSGESPSNGNKEVTKEEEEAQNRMKKELTDLQRKITENDKNVEELTLQVQRLQDKLLSEKIQWENKFLEEKKKLEEKINEQNKKLAVQKVKMEEISVAHEQELEVLLKKEEEEKRLLLRKLEEMEEAKKVLSQQLKQSDELHLLEKVEIEEKMQKELLEKEENIKELLQQHSDCLQSYHKNLEENIKNQELLNELDQVKNMLLESESRQKLLEKELAEINSSKDQANSVKSNILENMADLMESELQCSICSELFVTATTLNCTHTFCKYCIDTWKKKKKTCPICRVRIVSENRMLVMDNYIDRMVENLSDEFKSRRRAVIEERIGEKPSKICRTSSSSQSSTTLQPSTSVHRRRTHSNRGRNGLQ